MFRLLKSDWLLGEDEAQTAEKIIEEVKSEVLSHQQHHRFECPAYRCEATVQGDTYGCEQIQNTEDEVIVRQSVISRQSFHVKRAAKILMDTAS